jgi:hypothetical protein
VAARRFADRAQLARHCHEESARGLARLLAGEPLPCPAAVLAPLPEMI